MDNGWLQISTEGFAAFNKARPPGHLVKELVQNAFDALGDAGGHVRLDYRCVRDRFELTCQDDGIGIDDLDSLRVVYLTFKTDSHLKRGRFGRGFKEILSVAISARVASGAHAIVFSSESGHALTRHERQLPPVRGARVEMTFPWGAETVEAFDAYFGRFLPPNGVVLYLNGREVAPRAAKHVAYASVATEIYDADAHAWRKPVRRTNVHLVPIADGEDPYLYEMGIPVAPAEWSLPFHADIQQRVPMNPNRDALASGYATRIHAACLPVVLDDMSREEATSDWVGPAAVKAAPEVQKEVVAKAFGEVAVRSVPVMGKRDFNDDAQRAGAVIVNTAQMSSGFREIARAHLPSAKAHVEVVERARAEQASAQRITPAEAALVKDDRAMWIERRGGTSRVETCLAFAVWFCQRLIDTTHVSQQRVRGHVGLGRRPDYGQVAFAAHWNVANDLTLALEEDYFWVDPLGAECLAVLVHEAAHAMNLHHGRSFTDEVERLAGVAAALMYSEADFISARWGPALAGRR
jgi:hypothetical protein